MRDNCLAGPVRLAAVAIALAGVRAPVAAQRQASALDTIAPRIEEWARAAMDTSGIPAMSIALVRERQVVWTWAAGYANVAEHVPATPETYFSTGSTFKFVTAVGVMQLVERGLVSLDTPVNTVVGPELAVSGADDVTLRHLLTHYSGLRGPMDRVPTWSRDDVMSPVEVLSKMERVEAPGLKYRYCNACYGVLGYVIEKVSGETYDQYIVQRILRPLGIEVETATVPGPGVVERMALPYDVKDGTPSPVAQVRFSGPAAGDVFLRPSDMARFLAAMLNGGDYHGVRLLDSPSVTEMETAPFGDRGLGIAVNEFSGHRILIHNGSIPGSKAVMIGDPRTGDGVYIMSNANQSERPINLLARYAMLLLWNEQFVPPSNTYQATPESRARRRRPR